jgi:hypothetical protein
MLTTNVASPVYTLTTNGALVTTESTSQRLAVLWKPIKRLSAAEGNLFNSCQSSNVFISIGSLALSNLFSELECVHYGLTLHMNTYDVGKEFGEYIYFYFATWTMHFLMMSKRPTNASLIQCIGA